MSRRATTGAEAEALARALLVEHGLAPLATNWRRRLGEIDLVMQEPRSGTIVFVEVRYRRHRELGDGAESVDAAKRRRLRRAALAWLQRHADDDASARIDVVAVGPPTPLERARYADGATAVPRAGEPLGARVALRGRCLLEWTIDAVGEDERYR